MVNIKQYFDRYLGIKIVSLKEYQDELNGVVQHLDYTLN